MNNLEHTQTIEGKIAPNNESMTISVDSSSAMIPPTGAENLNEDNDIWKWISETPWEEFDQEDFNFLGLEKPQEISNSSCQLPLEFGHHGNHKLAGEQYLNPNEAKSNTLSPELRSLILWQSENTRFKGESAGRMGATGKAPLDDDITISIQFAGENNRKRKGIEVDDNYENNAGVRRRGAPRTSKAFEYQTHPGKKSNYSINDRLMALHELIPGSQKADMATTLGETVEYLTQVKIREKLLQEELKQLREAMGKIMTHSSVYKRMHSPIGSEINMGTNTKFGELESRHWAHPRMRMCHSSMSARMNKPSLLRQNYSAAAASSLFLPPQIPAPSQQQRPPHDKVLHNELFVLNEVVMKNVCTQENTLSTRDTKLPDKILQQFAIIEKEDQEFMDGKRGKRAEYGLSEQS